MGEEFTAVSLLYASPSSKSQSSFSKELVEDGEDGTYEDADDDDKDEDVLDDDERVKLRCSASSFAISEGRR